MALNKHVANILLRVQSETKEAKSALDDLAGKLRAFGAEDATAKANVEIDGVDKLAAATAALKAFERNAAVLKLDVQTDKAQAKLEALQATKNALEASVNRNEKGQFRPKEEKVKIAADISDVERDIGVVEAELVVLTAKKRKIEIQVDVDKNLAGQAVRGVEDLGKVTGALAGVFGSAGKAAEGFASKVGGVTVNLGAFGVKLGPLVALVIAVALAIGVTLVAALGLLVTALTAAAAAVGILATAFVAALGPAVALAVATVTKLTSLFKIAEDLTKAQDAATRKSAEGTKAAATAENARRDAVQRTASALRGIKTAERGVADARENAAEAIANANRAQADAARSLSDANAEVKQSTVDAYEAIKKAALDARDALLSVEDAKLGIQESDLAVQEAELNLQQFRKESGLAGKAFNDLFKKATDIHSNVDVSGLAGQFTAGGSSQEEALKGEKLVLALRRAKLNEKQANNQLEHSENTLADARKKQADFARDGIKAFEPYRNALKQQESATRNLADATREANKLNADGINGAPAVIAAYEALRRAKESYASAKADQATVGKGIADDLAKAKQAYDDLTPAQQRFVRAIQGTKKLLSTFFDPAVDSIINGIARGIEAVKNANPLLLLGLQGAFTELGTVVGDVFEKLGKYLGSSGFLTFFISLTGYASQLARIFGLKVFPALFKIFINIAKVALPILVRLMRKFGDYLSDLADKSDGPGLADFFARVLPVAGKLGKLVLALAGLFGAFFTETLSASGGFLDFLTNATNKLKAFIEDSGNQQKIVQFFKDIVPLVKAALIFIGRVIIIFGQLLQAAAPAITGILNLFNVIAGAVSKVLGFLRPVLQVVIAVISYFVGPGGLIAGVIKAIAIFSGFFNVKKVFDAVIGFIRRAANYLISKFKSAVKSAVDIIGGILGFLIDLPGKFYDFGVKIGDFLYKGIKSTIRKSADLLNTLIPFGDPVGGGSGEESEATKAARKRRDAAANAAAKQEEKGLSPAARRALEAKRKKAAEALFGQFGYGAVMPKTSAAGGLSAAKTFNEVNPTSKGTYIAKQEITIPPATGHDQMGDPREQAVKLATELRRRGKKR